jgi:predicted lysophospholipase L1 biosynthesis ABC-type transport system permease subunit
MLVCLAMGLTVVAVMLSVDHQRGLGIMKALGARADDVRGLYSRQFLVDFAVATAMGTVLSAAGINLVARAYGLPLSFPWVQSLLWLLIGVPVVWWGGQATAILFENADSLQLLSREAQFDWWALLRFGGLDKQ